MIAILLQVSIVLAALVATAHAAPPLPIIPNAQGFGIQTPGGSGRHLDLPQTRLLKVTNLNAAGPGSLRAALEAEGPRVVVFEVSGNIDCSPYQALSIDHPFITVAGQTAPSPGITLKACQLHVNASDVLIQHIRIRVGDLLDPTQPIEKASGWTQWGERDCMKVGGDRVVVDHCSFSWATDENVQTRGNDLTFRHNIFSEGLDSARHHKGGHSRGLLIMNQGPNDTKKEGQRIAVIGNLFAHNKGRNPTVNGGATAVVANNLIYNANFAMKADCTARRGHQLVSFMANVVLRTNHPVVARAKHPDTRYYVGTDNLFNGKTLHSQEEAWQHVHTPFAPGVAQGNRADEPPIRIPHYRVKAALDVEPWVLATAGARPADRDPVDSRVVQEVRDRKGAIPTSQDDLGGWPELATNRRALMVPPNPNGDDDGDGYTNLEEWLHAYSTAVEGNGRR